MQLRAVAFVALSAATVPDISQSTFAFYTDNDLASDAWSVQAVGSGGSSESAESTVVVDCAWIAEHVNVTPPDSACVGDPALAAYKLAQPVDSASGGPATLGEAAVAHCPASCHQCPTTRRACLRFSPTFQALLGVLQSLSMGLGSGLFMRFFSRMPLRTAFFRIQLMLPLASLFDVVLSLRWNVSIGLNDHLFGGLDTLVKATADAVKTVAVYTLVTQICPQQVEATLFSWVMGAQFMGSIVAQVLGGEDTTHLHLPHC